MKKPVKPDVKCDKCQFKSSLLQMKMHMKTVHGPRPARASKRLLDFTPNVAKRSKTDNVFINSEGIFNDSIFLMEESINDVSIKVMEEEQPPVPSIVYHSTIEGNGRIVEINDLFSCDHCNCNTRK